MRPNRMRLGAIAAWLGVIALGLDALVPIHLAFDLGRAFEHPSHRRDSGAAGHDLSSRLLALVTGHHDEDAQSGDGTKDHGKHHHADCAVCGSLASLAGFAPASAVLLPVSIRIDVPTLLAAAEIPPRADCTAAYRSRAPPIATADLTT
jgi:Protein of unknown function (DUF2946)